MPWCRFCKRFAILRAFDPADLKMLARVAGFDNKGINEVSQQLWMQFGAWFLR
jgi:hypothetical protein